MRGVILFNLGGPETLADVRPFLFRLFSDPDIIHIRSALARNTLAWMIATLRQRKSRDLYRQIGGGSPLRRITEGQAAALAERLAVRGFPTRVYVGMRCWKPTIDEAVEQIRRDGITQLVALPLFPQYSVTTTGSCFGYFRAVARRTGLDETARISYVDSWYSEPLYTEAMAESIRKTLTGLSADPQRIRLLYSAHSIPAKYVEEGDPYLQQTQATVALVNRCLGDAYPSQLSFQSKIGPVRWLEPSTRAVIEEFGRNGLERLVVIPVSFVSDHIETLQEIDILYREVATKAGIREFRRAASLNLEPKFIDALGKIALSAFSGGDIPIFHSPRTITDKS